MRIKQVATSVLAAYEPNLNLRGMTPMEINRVGNVIAVINERDACDCMTLDRAEKLMRATFDGPNWFIYRGGSHVALHHVGVVDRIMMAAERPARRR